MRFISSIIWDDERNPNGNVQHIAQHELSVQDVEHVLFDPSTEEGISRESGRPIAWGYTPTGRYIAIIFEEVIEGTIRVRTAFDAPEPGSDWRVSEQSVRYKCRGANAMATNVVRRIRGTGPVTPEEVAREQAVRRGIYAEFPSLRMTRYRKLAAGLAELQRTGEGHDSTEEDAVLEEMDRIWSKLTIEERDVIGPELAPALKRSSE